MTSYVHGASELLGVQIDAAINAGTVHEGYTSEFEIKRIHHVIYCQRRLE